jgi:hypothetical protein
MTDDDDDDGGRTRRWRRREVEWTASEWLLD